MTLIRRVCESLREEGVWIAADTSNAQWQTKDTGYSVLSSKEPVHTGSVLDVVVEALVCISLPECVSEAFIQHGRRTCPCVYGVFSFVISESLDRKHRYFASCVYVLLFISLSAIRASR